MLNSLNLITNGVVELSVSLGRKSVNLINDKFSQTIINCQLNILLFHRKILF